MRDIKVETLRGVACILLVSYHVVGLSADAGLKLSSGYYRDLNDLLAYIRMPLFTFLSGMVYAFRPFKNDFFRFTKSKAKRLLVPMLTIGTIFAILQNSVPGTNGFIQDWSTLHIYPVAHFWFLEAIFIIFLFIAIFEKIGLFENIKSFFIILTLSISIHISSFNEEILALNGAAYLFPFFLVGMATIRYELIDKVSRKLGLILFFLSTILMVSINIDFLEKFDKRTLSSFMLSSIACISIFKLNLNIKIISYIGAFSYSIFIYHVFFTASSRIFLNKAGIENIDILFTSGLILGITGPIVVDKILKKNSMTSFLFLGAKSKQ